MAMTPTPKNIADRVSERIFAERKGHGGGPISYMQVGQATLSSMIEAAINLYNEVTPAHGIALAQEVVREHENLEDRAPVEPECGHCNLGTGPHKRTCAYHRAKALMGGA